VKRKVRGEDRVAKYGAVGELPKFIEAFEGVKRSSNVIEVVKLIDQFDLLAKPSRRSGSMKLLCGTHCSFACR